VALLPKTLFPVALLAGSGCSASGDDPPAEAARNVLLITLDTCRADRLGCYGGPAATPSLERLAAEATVFDSAFTPVPSTLPSHCTLMTGSYPAAHGVHDNGVYVLGETATTLAERLHEDGYATAAFVSAWVLNRAFRLDQGFDVYDDEVDLPLVRGPAAAPLRGEDALTAEFFHRAATAYQRRAADVTGRACRWLESGAGRPYFLWVHYFDAHVPYDAPEPWKTMYDPDYRGPMDGFLDTFARAMGQRTLRESDLRHMVARYDGELSYMDHWVGVLLDAARRDPGWDETLVIVVGDHGEALGERPGGQIFEHNGEIYDEVVRVPLILRRPDGVGAGERVAGLVRTLDVAPTVLDWLGLSPLEPAQGVSLLALTADPGATAPGEVLLEARRERQVHPAPESFLGLRTDRFKVVLTLAADDSVTASQALDLRDDPGERQPLSSTTSPALEAQRDRILRENAELKSHGGTAATRELPAEELEALRALGYLKDGGSP
jgi:arylsulfatase